MRRPDLPGLVNVPVLVLSAVLASPAGLLLAQGLLTVTDVLIRYLLITLGCTALWGVVRAGLISVTARPLPAPSDAGAEAITGVIVSPTATPGAERATTSLNPDALDLPPEELVQLSLRMDDKSAD